MDENGSFRIIVSEMIRVRTVFNWTFSGQPAFWYDRQITYCKFLKVHLRNLFELDGPYLDEEK